MRSSPQLPAIHPQGDAGQAGPGCSFDGQLLVRQGQAIGDAVGLSPDRGRASPVRPGWRAAGAAVRSESSGRPWECAQRWAVGGRSRTTDRLAPGQRRGIVRHEARGRVDRDLLVDGVEPGRLGAGDEPFQVGLVAERCWQLPGVGAHLQLQHIRRAHKGFYGRFCNMPGWAPAKWAPRRSAHLHPASPGNRCSRPAPPQPGWVCTRPSSYRESWRWCRS